MFTLFLLSAFFSLHPDRKYIFIKMSKYGKVQIVQSSLFSISISTTHQWVKGIDENITVLTNNITGNG
jgi:hypothetical protein